MSPVHDYNEPLSRGIRLAACAFISGWIVYLGFRLAGTNQLLYLVLIQLGGLMLVSLSVSFSFETIKDSVNRSVESRVAEAYYEIRTALGFDAACGVLSYIVLYIYFKGSLISCSFALAAALAVANSAAAISISARRILSRERRSYGFAEAVEQLTLARELESDVFFSYSRDERAFALAVADALSENGLKVWIDTEEVEIGNRVDEIVQSGIFGSRHFVALLSRAYFKGSYTRLELDVMSRVVESESRLLVPICYDLDAGEVSRRRPSMAALAFLNLKDRPIWQEVELISEAIVAAIEAREEVADSYKEDIQGKLE